MVGNMRKLFLFLISQGCWASSTTVRYLHPSRPIFIERRTPHSLYFHRSHLPLFTDTNTTTAPIQHYHNTKPLLNDCTISRHKGFTNPLHKRIMRSLSLLSFLITVLPFTIANDYREEEDMKPVLPSTDYAWCARYCSSAENPAPNENEEEWLQCVRWCEGGTNWCKEDPSDCPYKKG